MTAIERKSGFPFATPVLARPGSNQLPDTSVHPGAVAIPLACAAWFLAVNWAAFAGGETSLLLAVVTLIFAMFLGLMAVAAAVSRDMTPERAHGRSFREFLNGEVAIATGMLSGRQVLWQIAAMPVGVAVGSTAIALIAVIV